MMHNLWVIGEVDFNHHCIVAMTMLLCKGLFWDQTFISCKFHHSTRENQLVPPVKISLKETDCSKLVDIVVATDLLQKYSETYTPSRQWYTFPSTRWDFGCMKSRQFHVETCCFVVTKMQPTVWRCDTLVHTLPKILEVFNWDEGSHLFCRHFAICDCSFFKQELCSWVCPRGKDICTIQYSWSSFCIPKKPNVVKTFTSIWWSCESKSKPFWHSLTHCHKDSILSGNLFCPSIIMLNFDR